MDGGRVLLKRTEGFCIMVLWGGGRIEIGLHILLVVVGIDFWEGGRIKSQGKTFLPPDPFRYIQK